MVPWTETAFGLFLHCPSHETFNWLAEKCLVDKKSKICLIKIAVANAFGEELEMIVTGKSAFLPCFKNIKSLPWWYRNQKKNWITGKMFTEWVKGLYCGFRVKDRKIGVLVNNCPAYLTTESLPNINLFFLQPNTTFLLHPMSDQEVIRTSRAHYQQNIVRKLLRTLDENVSLTKVSMLDAMKSLFHRGMLFRLSNY